MGAGGSAVKSVAHPFGSHVSLRFKCLNLFLVLQLAIGHDGH